MNEQNFRQILNDIAQEIPDNMDLWQDIQSEVDKPKKRKRQPGRSYLRWGAGIAAVLAVVLAGVGYVVYGTRTFNEPGTTAYNGDSGIMQAGTAQQITDLNIVDRHPSEDINIILNWGIADGNRIALGYTLDYSSSLNVPAMMTAELYDDNGNLYPTADFIRGGGGGGGGGNDREIVSGLSYWDARSISGNPDRIPLNLVLKFDYPPDSNPMQGGGGGGGGGDELPTPTPAPRKTVEPFTMKFQFSLPFLPAVHINDTYTVTESGIRMTMSDVSYATTVTLARLCFTSTDDRTWNPKFTPSPQVDATGMDFIADGEIPVEGEICGQLVQTGMLRPVDGKLYIQIDRLVSDFVVTQERIDAFARDMRSQGFELTLYSGDSIGRQPAGPNAFDYGQFGFVLTRIPDQYKDGAHFNAINDTVTRNFVDTITGPWAFEFAMP